MQSIQALRERRAAKAKEARKLLDDHPDEKWSKSVGEKVDVLYAEIEDLDGQVTRHQKMLDLEAENRASEVADEGERILDRVGGGERKINAQVRQLFNGWLRGGDQAIRADEWPLIRNTMSTGTGNQGGYTVQADIAAMLIDSLKDYGGVRNVAEVLRMAQGNPLSYPTSDGTAEVGELIGENTTANAADPTFGTVALPVYKYSSKIIACPFELLQDASIDIEAFINRRIRDRLGRITNQHFTTGTGIGQPNGIVTASTVGKTGTTGQTLTVIYDDLVDLIDSVDIAYQNLNNCKFMFGQTVRKVVRKLKDSTGRPIWMPSYEAGITGDFTDILMGFPVQINNDMPVPAANAKSIAFGDFSFYKVRDVMEATLFRFTDSAYAKLGQIGFLAWMRSGGNLIDTGATRLYQHSAT